MGEMNDRERVLKHVSDAMEIANERKTMCFIIAVTEDENGESDNILLGDNIGGKDLKRLTADALKDLRDHLIDRLPDIPEDLIP